MTRRDDASGGRLQIGILAGFASEHPAGFELECMAGFIGIRSNDQIFGDAGNDNIIAGAGDDQVDGGDGNDIIEGGAGADAITGGADIDTASYISSAAGITVDLAAGTGTGGDAQSDTLTGIEQVYGSNLADHLTGDAGNNQFWGAGGDDIITGGVGADHLKGGAGNDTFVYLSVDDSTRDPAGKDVILDFASGDKIDVSAIDADGNAENGDTAFTFAGSDPAGHGAEIQIVDFGNGVQGAYLYVNGDLVPDSIINVQSDHALTAADFVL